MDMKYFWAPAFALAVAVVMVSAFLAAAPAAETGEEMKDLDIEFVHVGGTLRGDLIGFTARFDITNPNDMRDVRIAEMNYTLSFQDRVLHRLDGIRDRNVRFDRPHRLTINTDFRAFESDLLRPAEYRFNGTMLLTSGDMEKLQEFDVRFTGPAGTIMPGIERSELFGK